MPSTTLDATKARVARRVLKGELTPLPKKPKGDDDHPETRRFIVRVADLDNAEEVIQTILARTRRAADYRRIFEPEWRQAIRAWFQRPSTDREDGWESDRFLPIIFKHVETAIPSLVAATLDGNRIWKMQGLTRQGKDAAKALERLVNWQAYTVCKADEAYEAMYWWSALIGTAFLDHSWDYREEPRFAAIVRAEPRPDGSVGKVKEIVEQDLVVADHPRLECLNPLDCFPDPDGKPGDEIEWIVERVRTTIGALRASAGKVGGHIDGEALETWIAERKPHREGDESWFDDLTSDTWDDWMREMGYQGRDDDPDEEDLGTAEKVVTVLRYRSKTEIITLGSPTHLIGYSRNPYLHGKTGILIHHFFNVPGSPFGRGIGTVLLGHQELSNENINRYMDVAAVEAAAPIIVQRSAVSILDDEWVFEPNKIVRALDVNGVKRMEVPAPTALAMTLDQHLQRDADDVTGFSEQARGVTPAASTTATAFSGMQGNLRTRLLLHVRRASRTITLSGNLLVSLDQQFITENQMVSIVGEDALDYVEVQPWEIVGKVLVRATLNSSRASPDLRAQRLLGLGQIVLPVLQQGGAANPQVRAFVRLLLEENEVEDVDLLLPKVKGTAQDPLMENEALKRGVPVEVHPAEDHLFHIQSAHGPLHEELLAIGAVGAAARVAEHIQKHLLIAGQMGIMAQGGGEGGPPQPGQGPDQGPTGNTPGEMAGGATEGAAARNGVPGQAAPGPAAAPGRPM